MYFTKNSLRRRILREFYSEDPAPINEEEEFDFLKDMDDDIEIPQTAPPSGQKDFEDEIFKHFYESGLWNKEGKKEGTNDFSNSDREKQDIFDIARATGYLEGSAPQELAGKTSEEIIAHYIGSERAQYDTSAEKIQGAKQSDGKRLVTLKSIYSSLSKADFSDDEIGKLAEFKGKDVTKLGNETIKISDEQIKKLNNMAAEGKSSYSTKEVSESKITRRQLRQMIMEQLVDRGVGRLLNEERVRVTRGDLIRVLREEFSRLS